MFQTPSDRSGSSGAGSKAERERRNGEGHGGQTETHPQCDARLSELIRRDTLDQYRVLDILQQYICEPDALSGQNMMSQLDLVRGTHDRMVLHV